jgi:hypothetical protein
MEHEVVLQVQVLEGSVLIHGRAPSGLLLQDDVSVDRLWRVTLAIRMLLEQAV